MPFQAFQPIALVNARLVDPARESETRGGLFARDGHIVAVGGDVTAQSVPSDARVVDCAGDVVAPGLVDMQAFVGEPGAEARETIATATTAAAIGGVTTIVSRADTHPPVDDPAVVDFLKRRARDTGSVRVLPMAALTRAREGKEIAEFGLLLEAGAVAFGDAGRSLRNAQVMRRALSYARDFDALIVHYAEERDLAEGVMNEG
ncbi:MAG TPA: dihydroorotase, partial [Rhodoblastus sp.]|nr:dihydroorotase [Rhodoblastus sp.]